MAEDQDMLPEPMTPADCDLQDFSFMPLHVARLRDSDLASEVEPEAAWYAVLLWAASWHQLPAASLPDNDAVLTKLVGLGRDLKTFRKHRDGALRGFVKCADGRLYHPVVAEQAMIAWNGKLKQRWRTECARIKKHNQRAGTSLPTPTLEQFLSGSCPEHVPEDTGGDVPRDTQPRPQGQSVQEKETGTETGKGRTIPEEGKPSSAKPDVRDRNAMAWAYAVEVLTEVGATEAEARSFFAGLLKKHKLQPGDMLPALAQAQANATPDPKSYLTAAAKRIAGGLPPEPPKRVSFV